MTVYISLRNESHRYGTRVSPIAMQGTDAALFALSDDALGRAAQGRDVVLGIHGFNVNQPDGARSLERLDGALSAALPDTLFIGVLWPGDFWLPVVNYPWEASDAVRCGELLATYLNTVLRGARSLSFVTHSLGGRVGLAAVLKLSRPVKTVCLTAAAVDDRCLSTTQYQAVLDKAEHVYVLASKRDVVLRLAYPVGDFLSDLFGDPDSPFRGALGFHGPVPAGLAGVAHRQIAPIAGPYGRGYAHSDYLPPADPASTNQSWQDVAKYVADALAGRPVSTP